MSNLALRPTRLTIDRNLTRALAISLAIHGLALGPAPVLQPPASEQPTRLEATLRPALVPLSPSPAAPKASPAVHAPVAPTAPMASMAPSTHHTHPKPLERTYEKPAGATTAAEAAPTPEPSAAAPAATDSIPRGEAAAPATAEAPPVQPVRPSVDLGGLRQFHLALGRMAARFRVYPPRARASGWEGRVPVRIAVSAGGQPAEIIVLGSSGYPVLDQAALEMMRLAAEHTPIPESLKGRAFIIDLAVEYNLRDD